MRKLLVLALFLLATPAVADVTDCNVVISVSQGKQVYTGQTDGWPQASPLEAATGEQWMLIYAPGPHYLSWWAVESNWSIPREKHRCGTNAEIDQVVFIFAPDSLPAFADDFDAASAIMESRFPNADVDLALLVGAVNHTICLVGGQQVEAANLHRNFIGLMTMPEAGPDLDIACTGYIDKKGHLTNAGATSALNQVAIFYPGN